MELDIWITGYAKNKLFYILYSVLCIPKNHYIP